MKSQQKITKMTVIALLLFAFAITYTTGLQAEWIECENMTAGTQVCNDAGGCTAAESREDSCSIMCHLTGTAETWMKYCGMGQQ